MQQKLEADIYSVKGTKKGKIPLPAVFSEQLEPELIRRAVVALQSAKKQPKGVKPGAGMKVAEYKGWRGLPAHGRTINVDRARLPRLKNRKTLLAGIVGNVPQAVGGRQAHPPKTQKKIEEKINKKERKKALRSAVAYTKERDAIAKRHIVPENIQLPVIVEDGIEEMKKTKEVLEFLKKIDLSKDTEYAKERRRVKAGKGRKRGRKTKKKKSILIITSKEAPVYKAARNLSGVDIVPVSKLNTELLAPGGMPGRLTLWSSAAIQKIGEW